MATLLCKGQNVQYGNLTRWAADAQMTSFAADVTVLGSNQPTLHKGSLSQHASEWLDLVEGGTAGSGTPVIVAASHFANPLFPYLVNIRR